ncbi:SDR family NAD(P)-dependent oxidoreductase [Bryobacter aggregatus]|uniref:SDR family NAD(P)-dependent oxidoreductase n=1 Tax=Bryobacter aggregatus TaxID=360054 RepID=UPI0004E13809|nr:SDR family oxidoreductase [Bryobacter aggregatus]
MTSAAAFSLSGKRALIAGASRGIGLAIAKSFAANGADTVLAARSTEALETEAAALRAQGFLASTQFLDMEKDDSIDAAAARGDFDILVNVSGTNIRKRFETYSPEEYEKIFQTNLHGLVRLTQKVGARMVERGQGGRIIHIGSLTSTSGLPYITIYSMTKSALAGLTRSLAAEWGRHNITVNCIAPGFIITDLNRQMWEAETMKHWLNHTQSIPRTGIPEDIAPLATFLAAPGAAYITGQVIAVDGGSNNTKVWPFEPPN